MVHSLNPQMGTQNSVVGDRIMAFLIDSVITAGIAITILFTGASVESRLVAFGGAVAGPLVYYVLFEGIRGQTVGKILTGVVVVSAEGKPCTFGQATVRNFFRIIDGLLLYVVGLLCILVTTEGQRVGDLIAGTYVVKSS